MACDCYIGLINDYADTCLVTLDELKAHIRFLKEYRSPYLNWGVYELNDYCDKRRNTDLTRFEYCPMCGKKIDWKAIKNSQ